MADARHARGGAAAAGANAAQDSEEERRWRAWRRTRARSRRTRCSGRQRRWRRARRRGRDIPADPRWAAPDPAVARVLRELGRVVAHRHLPAVKDWLRVLVKRVPGCCFSASW